MKQRKKVDPLFWWMAGVSIGLLLSIFAGSRAFGATWPIKVNIPEQAASIQIVQYTATAPVGTIASCLACSTLAVTANAAPNTLNQAVAFINYYGFDNPSAMLYVYDSRIAFSPTELLGLYAFRWSEPVDSSQLIITRDWTDTLFSGVKTTSHYRRDSTYVNMYAGHLTEYELRLFYNGYKSPSMTRMTVDMRDTGTTSTTIPPPSGYVYAYVNIGSGVIDSITGQMIPRDKVKLNLQLIGAQSINDSTWAIIPTIYTKSPDATGRATFVVPANTKLYPAGSYYELTYSAKDRNMSIFGTMRKFRLDTLPTIINILQAQEVR